MPQIAARHDRAVVRRPGLLRGAGSACVACDGAGGGADVRPPACRHLSRWSLSSSLWNDLPQSAEGQPQPSQATRPAAAAGAACSRTARVGPPHERGSGPTGGGRRRPLHRAAAHSSSSRAAPGRRRARDARLRPSSDLDPSSIAPEARARRDGDAPSVPRTACNSTLYGDVRFRSCGLFCKEAKRSNRPLRCVDCSFRTSPTSMHTRCRHSADTDDLGGGAGRAAAPV